MSFVILPRASWGAVPPKSKTQRAPGTLEGVTIHWFGKPSAAHLHSGCDDLLRNVQAFHMAPGGLGVPAGGADIAYNHGVCPHGAIYELRGFGVQTGANGTSDGNRKHCAIVYMAGIGDPLTEIAKAGLNFLIGEWRKKGCGPEVFPHNHWTGSTCPGADLREWISAGRPSQDDEEEEMPPWFAVWWKWRLLDGKPETRPEIAPDAIPQKYLDLVKVAEEYAARNDTSSAEVASLKAKIAKAKTALA